MPDYSKTVIYKLCCNDPTIEDIYIGSTCNFTNRKRQHKTSCNNPNTIGYNIKVYKFIRENGGWENWSMVMIHEQAVENKLQKERIERQFIDELKPSLNCLIPTRTKQEYKLENKEYISQYKKQHREKHKEYYKQYRDEHKDRNKETWDEYYAKNKDELNKTINCECGGRYSKHQKARHFRSQKHQNFILEHRAPSSTAYKSDQPDVQLLLSPQ